MGTYLLRYKFRVFIIVFCLFITGGISYFIPVLSQKVMDDGFLKNDHHLVLLLAFYLFMLQMFNNSLAYLKDYMRIRLNNQLTLDFYSDLYRKIQSAAGRELERKNRSQTVMELSTDIDNILMITDESFFAVLSQLFLVVGGVLGLFSIDTGLAWIVTAFIPIKCSIVILMVKYKSFYMGQFIHANSDFVRCLDEILHGFKDIRVYNKEAFFRELYAKKKQEAVNLQRRFLLLDSGNHILDSSFDKLMVFAIYISGAILLRQNILSLGSLFAFFTYSTLVTNPISAILNLIYILGSIKPSLDRYREFMAQEEELKEEVSGGTQIPEPQTEFERGGLHFQNITFGYENNTVINNFTFTIQPKEKVAIVGDNGTGKSTLLDLMLRIKTPCSGTILLHKTKINLYKIDRYRELFAPVFQKSFLFDSSVEENISLFDKDLCKSETAETLHLFLGEELSWKRQVGFGGVNVSGGEKQKILIARSILSNRPIIVWDESNAHLDKQSENMLEQFLHTTLKDKTVIVVTHKQSILNKVDKVIFLKSGFIHAIGDHSLLYAENIEYRVFVDSVKSHFLKQKDN